jgi:acetyltransferase-like isoleucine patch superfamily enzyme
MTGRKLFKYTKPFIFTITCFFSIVPRFLRVFIWDMISPYSQIIFVGFRYALLKSMIKKCGNNVMIGKNVSIRNWKNLEIGNNSAINANCYIDAMGKVAIGNDVGIGHNTSILSFDHTWSNAELPISMNDLLLKPVVIGNDVWIGAGCRILSGVTIPDRVVIAASAVVNKNCESKTLYGGVPAKAIKKI